MTSLKTKTAEKTLQDLLHDLRQQRGFDADFALQQKISRINTYFSENHLDSAVVGISGGIDSAVTFSLLARAMHTPHQGSPSPLRCLVGVLLPVYGAGTTRQQDALTLGRLLVTHVQHQYAVQDAVQNKSQNRSQNKSQQKEPHIVLHEIDGSSAFSEVIAATYRQHPLRKAKPEAASAWAQGQLASYIRTPILYYVAATLQSGDGHIDDVTYHSLVVGTTNRDEGAYLGFFGKASDGMVDLQPIGDLHKSEVYQLAALLSVPQPIMEATPSGDVYDGRVDEQMIGAPYWFVELYLLWLNQDKQQQDQSLAALSEEARVLFQQYQKNVEDLHRHNAHKYRVGSPAVFLDVYPRAVAGGWRDFA